MTEPKKLKEWEIKLRGQIVKVLQRYAISTVAGSKCYPASYTEEILALIKQADFVKLSDDQIPPAISGWYEDDPLTVHRAYWNDGWRKVQ